MVILTLNCGSSSAKYQVYDWDAKDVLCVGVVERIGLEYSTIEQKSIGKEEYHERFVSPTHKEAIELILKMLVDPEYGCISSLEQIGAVGHRVLHGGELFKKSTLVTDEVVEQLKSLIPLGPLHMPANIMGIKACRAAMPHAPQVAVFDTSFHQTMPPKSFMYALPYKYYEDYKVRRYGFHGTSHRYVAEKACEIFDVDMKHSKIVTCHIGSGASVTAILNGKSYDTSMGFTPVDGLIMGTRCGSTDPGALIYIAEKEGLNLSRLSVLINKESGMLGVTGVSSDMRDIRAAAQSGNERAQLAIEMFAARIKKFIGSYAALMGGLDMIVFTGGIGENDALTRRLVSEDLEFMGVRFNAELNENVHGENTLLSLPDSRVKVAVVATNEELVIASDTFRLTSPSVK